MVLLLFKLKLTQDCCEMYPDECVDIHGWCKSSATEKVHYLCIIHVLYSYGIRIYLNLLSYKAVTETNNH